MPALAKFWEYFSDQETYQKFMKQKLDNTLKGDDNEVVKFSFDD